MRQSRVHRQWRGIISLLIVALAMLPSVGCFSYPARKRPGQQYIASPFEMPQGTVVIEPVRSMQAGGLQFDLTMAGWFREVRAYSDCMDADYRIKILPDDRKPYYFYPSHNPAAFLLSIVIPFWWEETFGYHVTLIDCASGDSITTQTLSKGTVIMWGASPLINLLPSRAFDVHGDAQDAQLLAPEWVPFLRSHPPRRSGSGCTARRN